MLDFGTAIPLSFRRNEMFLGWRSRWSTDGLNNDPAGMNYTQKSIQEKPLYTHITVDIGDPPKQMRLGNPDELVSLWWYVLLFISY